MSRSKHILFTCYIIGICSLSFLFFTSNGLAATRDPIALHIQDTDTFLSKKLKGQQLVTKGTATRFRNRRVEIGKDATDTLGNIARTAFSKHNLFRTRLTNVPIGPNGVLLQGPIKKDMTYEFADSFVLVQSTSIIVQNPAELGKRSPQYKSFLGNKKPGKIVLSELERESQVELKNFMIKILPKMPRTHPLRKAAANKDGDQKKVAILQAIAEGKGLFETVEEIVIPKKMPRIINGIPQHPIFRNGVFHYNQYIPSRLNFINLIRPKRAIDKNLTKRTSNLISNLPDQQPTPTGSTRMTKVQRGRAKKLVDAKFLTGFTLASNWEWGKTWRFRSGLFRVKMGAGYAVGLRFPISVNGHLKPVHITTVGRNDVQTDFETSLAVKPVNGDVQFFEDAGYDFTDEPDEAHGKELALCFGFGYGYKFRALWKTITSRTYRMRYGYDHSDDFTPPYNRNRGGLDFEIPSSVTGTALDLGVIKGELIAHLKLSGTGTVSFDYESFHGDTANSRTITFRNPEPVLKTNILPPLVPSPGNSTVTEQYGFKLYNPVYKIHPTLTPGVEVGVRVGYRWLSRRFYTDVMWIRSLEMPLLPATFTRHAGTNRDYSYRDGRKTFRKR